MPNRTTPTTSIEDHSALLIGRRLQNFRCCLGTQFPRYGSSRESGTIGHLRPYFAVLTLLCGSLACRGADVSLPDYGYPKMAVSAAGHEGFVLLPTQAAPCHPWVWFAPVVPREPNQIHAALFRSLLANGVAVAGLDLGESYGNVHGRSDFSAFYLALRERFGLADKPCLLAQSRGGLMLYTWASENPEKVGCIAGIYPVLDMTTWPGLNRLQLQSAYQHPESWLRSHLHEINPIELLGPLARAKVPIFTIHGDSDRVVPYGSNGLAVTERYRALGGSADLVTVKGKGHEEIPGFFENPDLLRFLLAHTAQ